MSSQNEVSNTGQQAHITSNVSKTFIFGNKYITGSYNNAGYDSVTLAEGTVMGRIHATGNVVPLQSDAVDGSQIPLGILKGTRTVEAGDTVDLLICIAGEVVESKIVLTKTGDTLNTVISARRLRDRINGDTMGIKLVGGDELTAYDNS